MEEGGLKTGLCGGKFKRWLYSEGGYFWKEGKKKMTPKGGTYRGVRRRGLCFIKGNERRKCVVWAATYS